MKAPQADLTGWVAESFTGGGFTHDVYRKGNGPGVVLIPEMPGVHPGVLALGNHLVDNGFTVAIPSLFGVPAPGGHRAQRQQRREDESKCAHGFPARSMTQCVPDLSSSVVHSGHNQLQPRV